RRGAKEAGVSRNSAHGPGVVVVDLTGSGFRRNRREQVAPFLPGRRRTRALDAGGRNPKGRLKSGDGCPQGPVSELELQWAGHNGGEELRQRLSTGDGERLAEQDEADVAVDRTASHRGLRGRRQRSVDDHPPRSFERGSRPTGAQHRGHRRRMREEGAPSREAAAVKEEILESE